MGLRRAGLLGLAYSFARSERGKQMIREARQKYDTPANRDRARQAVSGLRKRGGGGSGSPAAGPTG